MKRQAVKCDFCNAEIMRVPTKTNTHFCNNQCKGLWQKRQRELLGYTKEWLEEEYLIKRRSADDIAREIGRNSKRVWEWLIDYGIPTRSRGTDYGQNFKNGHLAGLGRVLSDESKDKIRQKCIERGANPSQVNGVHWLKFYDRKPASYRGGITPDRQSLYASAEWAKSVNIIWKRDSATCQKCHKKQNENRDEKFHIHHIVSFEHVEHRTNPENLILLCKSCHLWVHSKKNEKKLFIKEITNESPESIGD